MKKIILGFASILLVLAVLGCGTSTTTTTTTTGSTGTSTSSSSGSTSSTTTHAATFWDQDADGIEDWQQEEITLTYSTWQHTSTDIVTIESLMLEKFMERYPNIHVEIQIMGASSEEWDANFIAASESGTLPDVFLVNRLASFLPYNILADITEYYDNDPDTDYIFPSVQELGTYDGVRYAIPTFIYPTMWIVNLDILEAAGVAIPDYDWTVEQMLSIAQACTNETTHIIGIYGASFFNRELPKILKIRAAGSDAEALALANAWQSYSFDGSGFNFNDPVFLSAMNMMREALDGGYVVDSLSAEQLEEYYLSSTYVPTYNGKVAMWRDASWSAKNYFADMLFNWDIYPGPSGVTGGNTDIGGISSTCAHQAAAYQLLKYMSFGEQGLLDRYQIYEDYADQVYISANNYGYPVVDYGINGLGQNLVWDTIPYDEMAPGFTSPEFIESLKNGAYWVNKETVGWDEADSVVYQYIYQVMSAQTTWAAVQDTVQSEAMAAFNRARETLDALIADLNP